MLYITAILAIISGIIYSRGEILGIDSLSIYYAITAIFLVFLVLKTKNKNYHTKFLNSTKFTKSLGISAAFILVICSFVYLFELLKTPKDMIDLLVPASMFISGFMLLILTIAIDKTRSFTQNIDTLTVIPVIGLLVQLIIIFRSNLINPNISEFILMIFSLMSISLCMYYFSAIFCCENKKNYFDASFLLSLFIILSYFTTISIAALNNNGDFEHIIYSFKIFVLCFPILLFLSQYYLKKSE